MNVYLDNIMIEDIVDEFGTLKEMEKDIKERLSLLRDELLKRGTTYAEGHKYTATVTHSDRTVFNLDSVKKEMGQPWVDARSHKVAVTAVKANRILKATRAA